MTATKRVMLGISLMAAMALAFVSVWAGPQAEPMGMAFTYQGQLKLGDEAVTDTCDMEFRLYADAAGTAQVGSLVSLPVSVADGSFTARLNFGGDAFNGDVRWLGIQVQCAADPSMVDLGLQPLTPAPYALAVPMASPPSSAPRMACGTAAPMPPAGSRPTSSWSPRAAATTPRSSQPSTA